ncbi:MAG: NAD(P)H-dependent oxidoreductase subunit E, partial [Candidatus Bathyarchaeia archaeon]
MESTKPVRTPEELEKLRQKIESEHGNKKPTVSICISTGCVALGATSVLEAFKTGIQKAKLTEKVEIKETGCLGFCEQGPRVTIYPDEICYFKVKPEDVQEIISQTIKENKIVERILYTDPITKKKVRKLNEIPFYKDQFRPLLENNARIDPKNILDYIHLDGYKALAKVISQIPPQQI